MARYKINAFTGQFDLDSNSSGGSAVERIATDDGTAFPSGGTIEILGGTGIETSASGDAVVVDITTVPTANGGLGGNFGASTGLISFLSGVASATLTPTVTSITINNAPLNPTDGANKAYVDLVAAGFSPKVACVVGTTANLTATYDNGASGVGATLTNSGAQAALVINGVTLSVNDRVLVKDQSSTPDNGIYVVSNIGSGSTNWVLTRSDDFDTPAEMSAFSLVATVDGTVNANTFWYLTNSVVTVGTTPVVWGAFLQQGILMLTGNSGSASGTNVTISGGNNITTTGSGSTLSVAVTGTTTNAVQLGNASGSLTSLAPANNATLTTNGSGVPQWTTTTSGYVTSITGTANQVIASASTGAVTLSLPQSIATTSTPTFAALTLSGTSTNELAINYDGGISNSNLQSIWTSYTGTFPNTAFGNVLQFRQARGSLATPSATVSGDNMMFLGAGGYQGTTPGFTLIKGGIGFFATDNYTSTAQGVKMSVLVTGTGSTTRFTALDVESSGVLYPYFGINLNSTTAANRYVTFGSSAVVAKGRLMQATNANRVELSSNLSFDGSNWNLDNTSDFGSFISQTSSGFSYQYATSGSNPRTPTSLFSVNTSGNGTFAGSITASGTITSSGDALGFITGANSNLKISSSGGDSTIDPRNFANTAQLVVPMGTGNGSVMRISESTATGSARAGFGVGDWYFIQDLAVGDTKTFDIFDNSAGASRFNFDTSGNGTFSVRVISPAFRMTTGATAGYIAQSDASGNFSWVAPGSAVVTQVQGTANQVLANFTSGTPQSGLVTLTTPQDIGTSSTVTFGQLNVDNLRLDGNTISSTNTSGDINIYPDSGGTFRSNAVFLLSNSQLIRNDANNAFSESFSFQKSTNGGNTANGCELGYINFAGYANSNYQNAARIIVNQQGSSSGSNIPAQMGFFLSDTSGLRSVLNVNSAGDLSIQTGDLYIGNDNKSFVFGAGNDAKIYYDGTNAVINPKSVGSGYLSVLGEVYSQGETVTNTTRAYGVLVTGTSSASTSSEQCGIRVTTNLTAASQQYQAGVYSIPNFANTGGYNNVVASFFADYTFTGNTQTIGTAYGLYAFCQGSGAGTILNAYGIGVLCPSAGGTNSCAIFSGGNSGFKKPAPTHTLELGDDDAAKTTTTTWTTTSDARIKRDIEDVESGLSVINALRPVKYKHTEEFIHHLDISEKAIYKKESDYHAMRAKKRNGCPNTTYYGFVADEVEQVMPSCVTTSSECVGEHEGIKKFNMHNILIMMVKSIQELSKEVDDLKSQLAAKDVQ